VIFVPFFHPGLISIVRISSTLIGLLQKEAWKYFLKTKNMEIMRLSLERLKLCE
jgi:hypothetical protein